MITFTSTDPPLESCPRQQSAQWHRDGLRDYILETVRIDPTGWRRALTLTAALIDMSDTVPARRVAARALANGMDSQDRVSLAFFAARASNALHAKPSEIMEGAVHSMTFLAAMVVLLIREDVEASGSITDMIGDMIRKMSLVDTLSLGIFAARCWMRLGGEAPVLRGWAQQAAEATTGQPTP